MNQFEVIFYSALLSLVIAILSKWIFKKIDKMEEDKKYKSNINWIIGGLSILIFFALIILLWHSQGHTESTPSIGIDYESKSLKAAWNNKGYILYKIGRCNEAIECYDNATRIDPNYKLAWSNKAVALKVLSRDSEAAIASAKAKELG